MVCSVTFVRKDKFKPTMAVSTFYLDDRSLLDRKKTNLTSWYSQYYRIQNADNYLETYTQ